MTHERTAAPPSGPTPRIPERGRLAHIFWAFLRFGLVAWGGPTVQISALHEEFVVRRRWATSERFRRALSVYHALPGPEAHELCCWLGAVVGGRGGALAAGLGFMLPGCALMVAAAALYDQARQSGDVLDRGPIASAFAGLQIGVVSLVLVACVRLLRASVAPIAIGFGWVITAAAALSQFVGVSFWFALIGGGLSLAAVRRSRVAAVAALLVALGIGVAVRQPQPPAANHDPAALVEPPATRLFTASLAGGLMSFGGAYTAIPIVHDIATGRKGWMTEREFLDGVAIAGVLPAPLVIFGTFVGYIGGGIAGAIVATCGMFLPAFTFTLLGHSVFERLVAWRSSHSFLDGVACAACGLIVALAIQLAISLSRQAQATPWRLVVGGALLAACATLLWRWRGAFAVPVVLGIAAGAGVLCQLRA